jgi:hypothetical protein
MEFGRQPPSLPGSSHRFISCMLNPFNLTLLRLTNHQHLRLYNCLLRHNLELVSDGSLPSHPSPCCLRYGSGYHRSPIGDNASRKSGLCLDQLHTRMRCKSSPNREAPFPLPIVPATDTVSPTRSDVSSLLVALPAARTRWTSAASAKLLRRYALSPRIVLRARVVKRWALRSSPSLVPYALNASSRMLSWGTLGHYGQSRWILFTKLWLTVWRSRATSG